MTKAQRKQIIRELIGRYNFDQHFSDADCKCFGEICGYDFEWVKRVSPKKGSAMAVHVSWPAGDYTGSWSWVRSVDGYDDRQSVIKAMREASRSGTFSGVTKDFCAQCRSTERLTVDHKSVSFSKIVELFIRNHGEPDIEHFEFGWKLVDPGSFVDFHDGMADYQVLCVSCNAKKGTRTN